jgi:hypothetical protein
MRAVSCARTLIPSANLTFERRCARQYLGSRACASVSQVPVRFEMIGILGFERDVSFKYASNRVRMGSNIREWAATLM